jgi:hypothetical protein
MNNNLSSWLDHLRILCPPTGVVLVGAGTGTGDWIQRLVQWDTPNVTLVEADDTQFQHLQNNVAPRDGWHLRKQVIAREAEIVTYFNASNSAESGLLAPESLSSVWPNLKTRQKHPRQAVTLAALQQDTGASANWLMVDCFPALPILQGAADQLGAFDVIAVRVLLDDIVQSESLASQNALQPVLETLGFRCLAVQASRHPALGHALYVRDMSALAKQSDRQFDKDKAALTAALDEQAKLAAQRQTALAALQAQSNILAQERSKLTADNAALTKVSADLGAQKDAEIKAKIEALAQRDALTKDKAALTAALDEQAKLAGQRQTALAALQAQSNILAQERSKLTADNAELTKVSADLGAQKDAETKAKIEALAALQSEQQARAKEKTELLKTLQDKLAHEHAWLAHSCIISDDLHQSVQKIIVSYKLAQKDLFDFLVELSDQINQAGDKVTALSYLNQARKAIAAPSKEMLATYVKRLIKLGKPYEAEAVFTQAALDGTGILSLSDGEKSAIKKASQSIHQIVEQKSEHGHDLLLSAFNKYLPALTPKIDGCKPVLIEIGTTREDVPGQGSTRKLADYCKKFSIGFITVDMDPHNSGMAQQMFSEIAAPDFQAITMKGEDYLRNYSGAMDFVFLDAYDFDHGKHSELRQSRYEKFLGSHIDETECHRMHLDCAQSVAQKLSPFGLVCVDDTWLEDGRWTAKGTLAVPYLLANGFELVEARNRAALFRRKTEAHGERPA